MHSPRCGEDSDVASATDSTVAVPSMRGLHAKFYVQDHGQLATAWLGSANLTGAAFGANVDILVELTGPKSHVGVDVVINKRGRKDDLSWIVEPHELPEDDDAESDPEEGISEVEARVYDIASKAFKIVYSLGPELDGGPWSAVLVVDPWVNADALAVTARPLSVLAARASQIVDGKVAWSGLVEEEITPFVVVTVKAEGSTRNVLVRADIEGDPPSRRKSVIAQAIKSPEDFLRYLAALLGLVSGSGPGGGEGEGGFFGGWVADMRVDRILEDLLTTASRNPTRLESLDQTLTALRADERFGDVVPQSFSAALGCRVRSAEGCHRMRARGKLPETWADRLAHATDGYKRFQLDTVDAVVRAMFDEGQRRFLVADEVGLGKTKTARALVAETVKRLWDDKDVDRIDVVYICSNAQIARQNLQDLDLFSDLGEAPRRADRLTMLPSTLASLGHVNLIALTPGTSFDLGDQAGRVGERAMLWRLLEHEEVGWGDLLYGREHSFRIFQGWASEARLDCEFRLARTTSSRPSEWSKPSPRAFGAASCRDQWTRSRTAGAPSTLDKATSSSAICAGCSPKCASINSLPTSSSLTSSSASPTSSTASGRREPSPGCCSISPKPGCSCSPRRPTRCSPPPMTMRVTLSSSSAPLDSCWEQDGLRRSAHCGARSGSCAQGSWVTETRAVSERLATRQRECSAA